VQVKWQPRISNDTQARIRFTETRVQAEIKVPDNNKKQGMTLGNDSRANQDFAK